MTQQIYLPTRIIFGQETLQYLKKVDYENILVVSTKSLADKYIKEIKGFLGDRIETFSIGKIKGEPTDKDIRFLNSKKSQNTDCIIGIGGGSYLDAAKALAIQEDSLENFDEDKSKVLPLITIVTTAGTGAEITKSGIIKIGDIKKGVRSEKLFPKIAIIDPRLCSTMSREITLYTGFDIFAHAVETFMSKKSTSYARSLSETTVKELFVYLPKAMDEFKEQGSPGMETREKLSYLAMLQGITLTNASTCLPHRIQYGLSTV